jgi:hypothetical protein
MQLAARVDLNVDQQALIARHRDGAGTVPRTPALRLLVQHGGRRRDEDEEGVAGQWEEVEAPPAADGGARGGQSSPSFPPSGNEEEKMVTLRTNCESASASATTTTSSSAASSPDRSGVGPSFDEEEDGAVVAAFVQQLFTAREDPKPAARPSSSHGGARDGSFDWDGFPRATAAALDDAPSFPSSAAATGAAATFSFYSTESERRRFFERVFAGEDGRGRAAFLAQLNLQRSQETNVGEGFEELAQLLWAFLLHAQRNRDVHGAKMGMMLASTFFRLRPQPKQQPGAAAAAAEKREFLSRRLQQHPLWKDAAFWTRALQDQIREQLESMGELLPFGAAAWHDASPEARAELVARIHNTVFSNAAALAHSMLEFGAPTEDAREFVLRVSEQYGLPEEQEHLLLSHLAKREQRHHQKPPRGPRPKLPAPAPAPAQQQQQQQQQQMLEAAQAATTM